MKRTDALVAVARAIMSDPDGEHYGYSLSRESSTRSGVLYPILKRLLDEGWLTDGWEDIDPSVEKRPARRYYRLTERGARELGMVARSQPASSNRAVRVRFA